MTDLGVGIGLVLVIEGLLWALAPQTARRMLELVADLPDAHVQRLGAAAVAGGVAVVWLVRG